MNISINYGIYHEHKIFFDEMAANLQKAGHKVGFISNLREIDPMNNHNKKEEIEKDAGFKFDFNRLWGPNETISNSDLWIAQRMDEEEVLLHFDDNAHMIKKYTGRWAVKVMNSADTKKF